VQTCPAGINIQGFIALIKVGKYQEALNVIMEQMPLPGTLGRICAAPCETQCRRQEVDSPLAICQLKRFAADQVDWATLPVPAIEKKPETEKWRSSVRSGRAFRRLFPCEEGVSSDDF